MHKYKSILCILFFILGMYGAAQSPYTDSLDANVKNTLNLTGGIVFQRQMMGEIGLNYGKFSIAGPCNEGYSKGIKLTAEFSYYHNAFLIGPKIGYEVSFYGFGLKASVVNYTNFKTSDTRLIPEIGFTEGSVNFYYGRNISLSASKFDVIKNSRFSIVVNIGKGQ